MYYMHTCIVLLSMDYPFYDVLLFFWQGTFASKKHVIFMHICE